MAHPAVARERRHRDKRIVRRRLAAALWELRQVRRERDQLECDLSVAQIGEAAWHQRYKAAIAERDALLQAEGGMTWIWNR